MYNDEKINEKLGGNIVKFNWINSWEIAIVIIMLIPNIIFIIKNPHLEKKCQNVIMNTMEQIGGYASMALMIVPIFVWKFSLKSVFQMICYMVVTSVLFSFI